MSESDGAKVPFEAYRSAPSFAPRDPDLGRKASDDELELISAAEGLMRMPSPPAASVLIGAPPTSRDAPGEEKYLWAVAPDGLPIAIEDNVDRTGNVRRDRPQRGRLSHTNLTGGGQAHSAGEMWFTSQAEICINGGSSRYPPRNAAELRTIAQSFARLGYRVRSMGWEAGINQPARNLKRDTSEWFEP